MKYLKNFNTLQEYEEAFIFDVPNTSYIVENQGVRYAEEPVIPNKYIVYTSNDGQTVLPYKSNAFGANIVNNTYENDLGVWSFDSPVTQIGNSGCFGVPIGSIIIPDSVTSIGGSAFYECSKLTSITIPKSVTSIGNNAFRHCSSLTSITIGNSVTSIGHAAFANCSSLNSITCEATTPPTLDSGNVLPNVTAVYVPAESVEAYKTATNWVYYSNVIQPIPS